MNSLIVSFVSAFIFAAASAKDICDSKPCGVGICNPPYFPNLDPSPYLCSCPISYGGKNCEKRVICQDGSLYASDVRCKCHYAGYIGTICQPKSDQPKTRCDSNPCGGGACFAAPASSSEFHCICPDGYKGQTCENHEHRPKPFCMNRDYYKDDPRCNCVKIESVESCGKKYDLPKTKCDSEPCVGGNCVATKAGSYYCHCWDGYLGKNCETRTN